MIKIGFSEISEGIKELLLPKFDFVLGIASGGIVPASLVAHELGCELALIHINFRHLDNSLAHSSPILLGSKFSTMKSGSRVLIVDDVSVTGQTINLARKLLSDYEISTLVLKGKADYVLFPRITSCVEWPWKI